MPLCDAKPLAGGPSGEPLAAGRRASASPKIVLLKRTDWTFNYIVSVLRVPGTKKHLPLRYHRHRLDKGRAHQRGTPQNPELCRIEVSLNLHREALVESAVLQMYTCHTGILSLSDTAA